MAAALAICLFVCLSGSITLFGYLKYVRPTRILDRLVETEDAFAAFRPVAEKRSVLKNVFSAIGGMLPASAADVKLARRELSAAGFRSGSAVVVFSGIRLAATAAFLLIALLVRNNVTDNPVARIAILVAGGALGYFAPDLVLGRLSKRRQLEIRFALPDVLDLLVICSEVGCGLDQSILNVSRELAIVHPAICDELSLVNLEILAGASRAEALRSFAERTGEDEIKKLIAILVQTDKFGTSISEALRTQSDYLRVRRRQEAEERAGKVGVKLVFPIFFFCMPSLLIVTAGPGMLQLMKNLLPAMKEFH
jgi:tight adherence protein C